MSSEGEQAKRGIASIAGMALVSIGLGHETGWGWSIVFIGTLILLGVAGSMGNNRRNYLTDKKLKDRAMKDLDEG